MTKAEKAERQQAIDQLREWLKPGDTVYTVLEHVSRSGMQREIRVLVPYQRTAEEIERGYSPIDFLHPNHAVAQALGLRQGKRDGLIVGGCGMDMGFHLVYELSSVLYGYRRCSKCGYHFPDDYPTDVTCGKCDGEIVGGYRCLGKGKCPSNYHVNHHDTIRCEGTRVYNPDGEDTGGYCYDPWSFGRRDELPESWPRAANGAPLYAVHEGDEDSGRYVVCPTCKGKGRIPNPEGPERFDLLHTDGYALRHRWL